ncbi:MAG: methionyl-tRNA formyltransferase [Firmicutes bacterium]|nr:methionyl-tRNA formyltransferase [Bacillota bacterium]
MRIIFMGTPKFAVPILNCLLQTHEIIAVVTQPDRPKGRGYTPTFSAVKEFLVDNNHNIPILQPEKVRNSEFISQLQALQADVFVVVAYGQILPVKILNIPPLGCINIHASLLPKYRGAAPIQWAILNGEHTTGISIMYMDKGMDTGDVILQKNIDILPTDTFGTLHDKMQETSCECILSALQQISSGTATRTPQDNEQATYAPMLTKEIGLISWGKSSQQIYNQIRALAEWPGTYSYVRETLIKIFSAEICENFESLYPSGRFCKPGRVMDNEGKLLVKTGNGAIYLKTVQKPNSKKMDIADYLRGNAIELTDNFGLSR